MTINNTCAYNRNDHDYKSAQFLIRGLLAVASRGGNFLLNVGPQPDGQIQPEFQERLCAIGDWLGNNGDSIYGSTYVPIQNQPTLRSSAKNQTVFVHLLEWPSSPLTIDQFEGKVVSERMLDDDLQLNFRQTDTNLRIDLPAAASNPVVRAVAVQTR